MFAKQSAVAGFVGLVLLCLGIALGDEEECGLDAIECAVNWQVYNSEVNQLYGQTDTIAPDGRKAVGAPNVRIKLERLVGTGWVEMGLKDNEEPTSSGLWKATFAPPMGGWPAGDYRLKVFDANFVIRATRSVEVIQ